tara:strand:+ start:313 stop:528 length:216 start_codon:yes stop_codon:yes gene_type:complete
MITFLIILHVISIYQLRKAYKWKKSSKYSDDDFYEYFFGGDGLRIIWICPVIIAAGTDLVLLIFILIKYLP